MDFGLQWGHLVSKRFAIPEPDCLTLCSQCFFLLMESIITLVHFDSLGICLSVLPRLNSKKVPLLILIFNVLTQYRVELNLNFLIDSCHFKEIEDYRFSGFCYQFEMDELWRNKIYTCEI